MSKRILTSIFSLLIAVAAQAVPEYTITDVFYPGDAGGDNLSD